MRCKIVRFQKLMWRTIMKSIKSQKSFSFTLQYRYRLIFIKFFYWNFILANYYHTCILAPKEFVNLRIKKNVIDFLFFKSEIQKEKKNYIITSYFNHSYPVNQFNNNNRVKGKKKKRKKKGQ